MCTEIARAELSREPSVDQGVRNRTEFLRTTAGKTQRGAHSKVAIPEVKPMRYVKLVVVCVMSALMVAGCGRSDAYVPGLGEIMSLQQMRHAKLWLAGQAENWGSPAAG